MPVHCTGRKKTHQSNEPCVIAHVLFVSIVEIKFFLFTMNLIKS